MLKKQREIRVFEDSPSHEPMRSPGKALHGSARKRCGKQPLGLDQAKDRVTRSRYKREFASRHGLKASARREADWYLCWCGSYHCTSKVNRIDQMIEEEAYAKSA
jgi:hypothetical protein